MEKATLVRKMKDRKSDQVAVNNACGKNRQALDLATHYKDVLSNAKKRYPIINKVIYHATAGIEQRAITFESFARKNGVSR